MPSPLKEQIKDVAPEESNVVPEDIPPKPGKSLKRKPEDANAQVSTRNPGKSLLPFSRVQKILKADKVRGR